MNISWIYIYISRICHEYIRILSGIYHEHIMNISLNHNQQIAKTGHFPLVFPTISGRMLPPSGASTPAPESELWECAGLRCAKQPMACHAWKCGPHEIWVENRTSFVPKHQGFLKNTFLDAQKGTVWGLKPQILAYSCWYFPVFCCSRWLLVINCSFWNEQM